MIQLRYSELQSEDGDHKDSSNVQDGNHKDSSNVQESAQDFVQDVIIEGFWQSVFWNNLNLVQSYKATLLSHVYQFSL